MVLKLMLQLQPYDLHLQFRPGSEVPVANVLSRLQLSDIDEQLEKEINVYLHLIFGHLTVGDYKILLIQEETVRDCQLRILSKTIHKSWPKSRKMCQTEARLFWNIQHEISTIRGIIFKGERLIIPKALQPDILKQLYTAHLGIEKTKKRV